jgi:putative transposase
MRKPRELKPGATYHVIAKTNRGEMILKSPIMKELLMIVFRRAKKKYSFNIKNFCIMGNHFHLMIEPLKRQNLSDIMRWILSVFAVQYNTLHNCYGHVWYDRFKSKVIYSFWQYLTTFIYIARNPVRANIVKRAVEFPYNGVSFYTKGKLDIMERPPTFFVKHVWPIILR